jgi:hypothetical protein
MNVLFSLARFTCWPFQCSWNFSSLIPGIFLRKREILRYCFDDMVRRLDEGRSMVKSAEQVNSIIRLEEKDFRCLSIPPFEWRLGNEERVYCCFELDILLNLLLRL